MLNLTIPAAHFDISLSALSAGKHVFTEKPLATSAADGRRLVAEAAKRGLLLGSAPDTFLGAAGRRARRLMDEGAIGRAVTGTAFMLGRGMEHWHPNPQFYYQPGGGPVFDMGPYYLTMLVNLLGPVARVRRWRRSGQEERLITAEGPYRNTASRSARRPTSCRCSNSAPAPPSPSAPPGTSSGTPTIRSSCTARRARCGCPIPTRSAAPSRCRRAAPTGPISHSETELYGARNWPFAAPDRANYRMLGVADLARALTEGRKPRASGELALHVLEVMEAILASGESQGSVAVSRHRRPAAAAWRGRGGKPACLTRRFE